jgi:hypothetical protein
MATKPKNPPEVPSQVKDVRVRGKTIPSFGGRLVIVRTGAGQFLATHTRKEDVASVLVPKAGSALRVPGIDKNKVVFRGRHASSVFSYSMHPDDPTKMIREDSKGNVSIGRVIDGKFRTA